MVGDSDVSLAVEEDKIPTDQILLEDEDLDVEYDI